MQSASQRAAHGASLLDRKEPGWASDIDLNILDMAHHKCCVLGQKFSMYFSGLRALGLSLYDAEEYGFIATGSDTSKVEKDAEALTAAFTAEVKKRTAAHV